MLRTALVTGAGGFIASNLIARLLADGVAVHALVRASSSAVPAGVNVHVDRGDVVALAEELAAVDIDVCFHLASHFVAEHAPSDISALVESNVAFPCRLAEALGERPDLLFVNTGSAWQHVDAQSYRPSALYAATKQAFHDVLRYYVEAGRFRAVELVLFDTYGPGDPRPKLLSVLRQRQAAGEVMRMNPGEQLIDLVYVDDVVEAFLAAVRLAPAQGELPEYEVRSGRALSLRDLFALVEAVTGKAIPVAWGAQPYRAKEMMQPWWRDLPLPGWAPAVDLEEGIRRTWAVSR